MTTTNDTTTCDLCRENIDQHTGKYLVCPDGIHEFESIREARAFERSAYLNLADEFDLMGDAPDAKPLAFIESDWDASAVAAAKRFASRLMLPLPWDVRSIDNALRYVEIAERAALVRDRQVEMGLGPDLRLDACDGFTGSNAWGACAKCGDLLTDHRIDG